MPLSVPERRVLADIERRLSEDDPTLAAALREFSAMTEPWAGPAGRPAREPPQATEAGAGAPPDWRQPPARSRVALRTVTLGAVLLVMGLVLRSAGLLVLAALLVVVSGVGAVRHLRRRRRAAAEQNGPPEGPGARSP